LQLLFAEFSLAFISRKQATVVLKSSRFCCSALCKHVPPALKAPESGNALVPAAVFPEML